jgi:hypothetical protein
VFNSPLASSLIDRDLFFDVQVIVEQPELKLMKVKILCKGITESFEQGHVVVIFQAEPIITKLITVPLWSRWSSTSLPVVSVK